MKIVLSLPSFTVKSFRLFYIFFFKLKVGHLISPLDAE